MTIHPTAIIDPDAVLGDGVEVGPYSIIGPGGEIAPGTWIGPHAVINGPTRIGRDNRIFQFASIGEIPQDKKFHGEDSLLEIGDRNTIREYATINRGTAEGGGVTRIGSDNWLMAYIHVAHDCEVGDHTIMANAASLAGHARLEDYAILGGFTLVHQFCAIGAYAFTAMGSAIAKDVPPFVTVAGNPATPRGVNVEGLRRHGFSQDRLQGVRELYRLLYRSGLGLDEARARIEDMQGGNEDAARMAEFLRRSRRSIVR